MNNYNVEFLKEANQDLDHLNKSVKIQVLKGIKKVSKNPLPQSEGGYGKPLGNKFGLNLTNLLKIKFLDIGIRVVYKLGFNTINIITNINFWLNACSLKLVTQ